MSSNVCCAPCDLAVNGAVDIATSSMSQGARPTLRACAALTAANIRIRKRKDFKFIFLLVKLRLVSAGPLGVKVDQPVDADCTVSWGTRQRKLIKLQKHIMLSQTIVRAIWQADAARHAASRPGMQIYPQASRCLGLCWFPSSLPHFIVEAACSLLFCA